MRRREPSARQCGDAVLRMFVTPGSRLLPSRIDGLLPIDEILIQRMPLADLQRGIDLVASGATSIKVTLEP